MDWVRHGLQLHEHAVSRFEEAKITGYDFPELLENDGRLLESHLGLSSPYERRRVQRGMRMKLMGMGRPPVKPFAVAAKSRGCSSVLVEWKSDSADASFPVHKFVLQRREPSLPRSRWGVWWAAGNSSAESQWRTVYEGMETRFEETGLATDEVYSYRIVAWNVIGRSEYEYVSERTVTSPCLKSGSWLWSAYAFLERLLQFALAVIAFVASASRLSSSVDGYSNYVLQPILGYIDGFTDRMRAWGLQVPPLSQRPPPLEIRSPSVRKRELLRNQTSGRLSKGASGDSYASEVLTVSSLPRDGEDDDGSPPPEHILNRKYCSVCREKFSDWDRRVSRHSCSRCHGHFHAKCGATCHGPLFPCPVQGGCKCNNCRDASPSRRTSKYVRSTDSSGKLDKSSKKQSSSLRSLLRMNSNFSSVSSHDEGDAHHGNVGD